jgi:ketosteroid isomerase-like protein
VISEEFIKAHIDRWGAAWNSRDLKTVLAMYCDDVEFSSPKIRVVLPDKKESTVSGKAELEQYWSSTGQPR